MASLAAISASSFLHGQSISRSSDVKHHLHPRRRRSQPRSLTDQAAKLPVGVEAPGAEPKLTEPVWGFTRTAEVWNSRASMIGIIATFVVELILHGTPPDDWGGRREGPEPSTVRFMYVPVLRITVL